MADSYIRAGHLRSGYSMMYHEIFDLYHPYIGDTATLIYLYLLRSRNNEAGNPDAGKSWRGRRGMVEKFRVSFSTLKVIDDVLQVVGLIRIETKPSKRGKPKIIYVVNDPLDRYAFREVEPRIIEGLRRIYREEPRAKSVLGKEKLAEIADLRE